MTNAQIHYESDGQTVRMKLRPGQCLVVGGASSADIQLENTDDLASQHCEIQFRHGRCVVSDLTEDQNRVKVNGSVIAKTELRNGDEIQVGGNLLTFQDLTASDVGNGPLSAAGAGTAVVAAGAATQLGGGSHATNDKGGSPELTDDYDSGELHPDVECLPNGVRSIELDDYQKQLLPLLTRCEPNWECGILLNHRASKLELPSPSASNLLADAPDTISNQNDLFYQAGGVASVTRTFDQYANADAATLALTRKNSDSGDVESDLKLLAAWFVNPERIRFHLRNGSELLLSKVFGLLKILVIPGTGNQQQYVMLQNDEVNDWDSFVKLMEDDEL